MFLCSYVKEQKDKKQTCNVGADRCVCPKRKRRQKGALQHRCAPTAIPIKGTITTINPGFAGIYCCLWANRAHRVAVVAAVAVPVVAVAAEEQVVSADAVTAMQRTRPIAA